MFRFWPATVYDPAIELPNTLTENEPVDSSPLKVPPWPAIAVFALLRILSAEPLNGIKKLHAAIGKD